MECSIELNKKSSDYNYEPYTRKGKCCDYISCHREGKELPVCYFPDDIEKDMTILLPISSDCIMIGYKEWQLTNSPH